VLSDIHLGSDIVDGSSLRPPARSKSVDDDLCALLVHYRDARADTGPWHLVINGDFIDFIGMSIGVAGASLSTDPTAEEKAHGLGTAEDHACAKLARVAVRHEAVFAALGSFVAAGHHLTIVHGNHDREFHWQKVRDDLRSLLARAGEANAEAASALAARIRFSPWFFWQDGVAYIEHGAQYDTYCATEHVMTPVSPVDRQRLSPGFSDVLLRFVVHRTRGLRPHGHDRMGLVDYVSLALSLGVRGAVDLATRFVRAIVELFRLRRIALGEGARDLRAEHERRVALLSEAMRIGLDRLMALGQLQAQPVTRSIRGILASVLLDRLALGVVCTFLLLTLAVLGFRGGHLGWGIIPVLPAWWLVHRYLRRSRHVDPEDELAARAGPLSRLFPAAFVVMGHTHVPKRMVLGDGTSTYINTGSWSEEEGIRADSPIAYRAARTHLVIRVQDGCPAGELLTWHSSEGPRRFASP